MKFTMYEKEIKDKKYRDDPYRAVNFPIDTDGDPICPLTEKKFHYLYSRPVRGKQIWQNRRILSM